MPDCPRTNEGGKRRPTQVYLVDDDRAFVETLRAALSAEGFRARAFTDPIGALAAIRAVRPDVVVLDYVMPAMTGIEFMKSLAETHAGVPVVLVTALCDPYFLLDPSDPRSRHVISKPVDIAHLVLEIERATGDLGGHRPALALGRQVSLKRDHQG
jgi:DNA-binding NtrC family response regulator